jgi:hypothetical protein
MKTENRHNERRSGLRVRSQVKAGADGRTKLSVGLLRSIPQLRLNKKMDAFLGIVVR